MSQRMLNKIFAMAEKGDPGLQCAAIRILGELGLKDKKSVGLLSKKLSSEDIMIRSSALDAIVKAPSRDYAEILLRLLEGGGDDTKKAYASLCAIGSDILPILKKRFQRSADYQKKMLINIIMSLRSAQAWSFLLDSILTESLEILKHICFAFREHSSAFTPKERRMVFTRLKQCMAQATKRKNYVALTSYIILLGSLNIPASKRILLSFLKKEGDAYVHVRRNALIALMRINLSGRHDDVAEVLLHLIEKGDLQTVKYAVEILKSITFSAKFNKTIQKFLQSPYPELRSFSISCFGNLDSGKNAQCLVEYLRESDRAVQEATRESLGRMPSSVPYLIKKLNTVTDENEAFKIAQILKMHKNKVTVERCKTLFGRTEQFLNKGNDQYKIYYTVLKLVVPEYLYKVVLKKVQLLKGRKKFKDAERYAALLSKGLFFTDEVKYEVAVISLKNSSKNSSLLYRNNDPTLQLFEYLIKSSDMALTKRVKNERVLDVNDLFYLGFHFSEKLFELKEFGTNILRLIIKKYPRSKVTAKVKKKLAQVGA